MREKITFKILLFYFFLLSLKRIESTQLDYKHDYNENSYSNSNRTFFNSFSLDNITKKNLNEINFKFKNISSLYKDKYLNNKIIKYFNKSNNKLITKDRLLKNITNNLNQNFANKLFELINDSDKDQDSNMINELKYKYKNSFCSNVTLFADLSRYESEEKEYPNRQDLYYALANFVKKNINNKIFNDPEIYDNNCKEEINSLLDNKYKSLFEIIGFSGKNLHDNGQEVSCKLSGYRYYTINIELNNIDQIYDKSISFMYKFLGFDSYTLGVCFINNCTNLVNNIFNETSNPQFYKFLSNKGIKNITVIDEYNYEYPKYFKYKIWFMICYLMFKMICTFFCLCIRIKRNKSHLNNSNRIITDINNNKSLLIGEENEYNQDNLNDKSISTDRYIDLEYLDDSHEITLEKEKKNEKLAFNSFLLNNVQMCIFFLYEFFSFNKNFKHLTDRKNIFFNNKNLESINYVKCILLFICTFNQVFFTSIIFPHRDFFNVKSFYNIIFGIFKISNFALDCFIALQATTMSFKLMSYVKKKGCEIKTFLKFYFFALPKIIIFLFIYFILQIQFEDYGTIFFKYLTLKKVLIDKFRMKECYEKNSFLIFNFPDFCYSDKNPGTFIKCFKFTYIYINMFICYNLFLVIFYFSLKLKSKLYDYTVSLIFLVLFLTLSLNFNIDKIDTYTFWFISGELLSFKYVHIFAIKYFIGVLCGLFYFYSKELVLTDSYINRNNHMPFKFIYHLIVYLDIQNTNDRKIVSKSSNFKITSKNTISSKINEYKTSFENKHENSIIEFDSNINNKDINKSNRTIDVIEKYSSKKKNLRKVFFICFSISIQIFLGFYHIIKVLISNKQNEIIPFSIDLRILYYYERTIYVFFFTIMIATISLCKNTLIFGALINSKLFFLLARINLVYLCIQDNVVYLFYIVYDIEFFFTYQNVFFITLGIIVINFILSFIFVYLFELPIRKLIKIIY